MYKQVNSSELLIGFWRVFVTNVRYVPSQTSDRILLLAGLCVGIAHGVPLGLPIQESTGGNLFPDYMNRHRLIKLIYGRFGKGINTFLELELLMPQGSYREFWFQRTNRKIWDLPNLYPGRHVRECQLRYSFHIKGNKRFSVTYINSRTHRSINLFPFYLLPPDGS